MTENATRAVTQPCSAVGSGMSTARPITTGIADSQMIKRRVFFRDVLETDLAAVEHPAGSEQQPGLVGPLRPYREVHKTQAEHRAGYQWENIG